MCIVCLTIKVPESSLVTMYTWRIESYNVLHWDILGNYRYILHYVSLKCREYFVSSLYLRTFVLKESVEKIHEVGLSSSIKISNLIMSLMFLSPDHITAFLRPGQSKQVKKTHEIDIRAHTHTQGLLLDPKWVDWNLWAKPWVSAEE